MLLQEEKLYKQQKVLLVSTQSKESWTAVVASAICSSFTYRSRIVGLVWSNQSLGSLCEGMLLSLLQHMELLARAAKPDSSGVMMA